MESEAVSTAVTSSFEDRLSAHERESQVGKNQTEEFLESYEETPRLSEAEDPRDDVEEFISDDLRDQIVRQVEYYFSDENLPTDKFMLKYVKRDKEGYVPIEIIASFRRMKSLVQDLSLVEAALRTSSLLVVSSDGKKVKRLNPLIIPEASDSKPQTVLVENLQKDCSAESLQKIFGKAGIIKNISIIDPHSMEDPATTKRKKIAISSKLHALVEYETTEAAQNAVATLNDEKNWRTGLRVELLVKRMEKYGLLQKTRKDAPPISERKNEDNPYCQNSEDPGHNDDSVGKEDQERQPSNEKAGRKGQNKGRGRGGGGSKSTSNGHGSAPPPLSSSVETVSRPPPGPRMPDGTRGFSMGRGKPIPLTAPNIPDPEAAYHAQEETDNVRVL